MKLENIVSLLTLTNERSPHIDTVIRHLQTQGCHTEIVRTGYEFQKGANEMLKITRT